jgi:hypothetical protein
LLHGESQPGVSIDISEGLVLRLCDYDGIGGVISWIGDRRHKKDDI